MQQLDLIQWLQSFHNPLLDEVMVLVSNLGGEDFYLFFGPIFFWCLSTALGVRLLVTLITSFYVNDILKDSFATVRPILSHPDAVRMPPGAAETAQDGHETWLGAFPSGHAQNAVVFWMFIATWARKPWVWALSLLLIALISVSRIYLGVHWPVDILGGWAIGGAIIAGLLVLPGSLERLTPSRREQLILLAATVGVGLFLLDDSLFRARMLGFWSGALYSLVLQRRFVPFRVEGPWWQQLLKVLIGLGVVFALRAGLKLVLPEAAWGLWLRYVVMGVWVVLGAPAVFRLLFGAPEREAAPEAAVRA